MFTLFYFAAVTFCIASQIYSKKGIFKTILHGGEVYKQSY